MTDAMLELAGRNRAEAGIENVGFLKGVIEEIPLPAESVDVVISNCVINLSADKARVLRETYRVLVPADGLPSQMWSSRATFCQSCVQTWTPGRVVLLVHWKKKVIAGCSHRHGSSISRLK